MKKFSFLREVSVWRIEGREGRRDLPHYLKWREIELQSLDSLAIDEAER
jgi:hypothetical protein